MVIWGEMDQEVWCLWQFIVFTASYRQTVIFTNYDKEKVVCSTEIFLHCSVYGGLRFTFFPGKCWYTVQLGVIYERYLRCCSRRQKRPFIPMRREGHILQVQIEGDFTSFQRFDLHIIFPPYLTCDDTGTR